MFRSMSKGKIATIVVGVIAIVLTGIIVTSMVIAIKAAPGNEMPIYTHKKTSAQLGTDENPYTILEIVPDTDSGMVGYLVKGQEPTNLLTIGTTNPETEGSPAYIYSKAFDSRENEMDASEVGKYSSDAHIFMMDADMLGDVDYDNFSLKTDEYQGETTQGNNKGFSQFGYYTKVEKGAGTYVYDTSKKCFVPAISVGDINLYDNYTWTSLGEFKHVGYGYVDPDAGQNGQVRFKCTREMYTDKVDAEGAPIPRGYSYKNMSGEGKIGKDAYNYYFTPLGDFEWIPNNNYNNENVFVENATEEQIVGANLGDKLYMTRTEDYYYEYSASPIVSNDILIKELVGYDKSSLDYKTQVVTVTPNQLVVDYTDNDARDIIRTADMIIIHDDSTGYRIKQAFADEEVIDEKLPQFSNANGNKDLTEYTVNEIIERGAGGNPAAIIFDEDAISKGEKNGCSNLKLLYDIYNNVGAKLAYNWKYNDGTYAEKLNELRESSDFNYRNFSFNEKDALGMSHFVYNFEGADDSWLTTGFVDDSKINRSKLNEPAFENMGLKNDGDKMSVAKMLSAVNRESDGYNQPRHLNILEIQPNEVFWYDNSTVDYQNEWILHYLSIFPWFIGTNTFISSDLTIDTMPTYEFIGKNVDLNEKYDLIIVGNYGQDATNGGNWQNGYTGNKEYGYNDNNFPKTLSYTAVGDLVNSNSQGVNETKLRYTGNDITKKKYDQIMNFSKQAPVIVESNMYKEEAGETVVNKDIVDESSFVYQVANKNGTVSTINRYSNAVDTRDKASDVKKGIVNNKCSFTFIPVSATDEGKPLEYAIDENDKMNNNTQTDGKGNNILQYHIRIDGEANTAYGLELYLDNNGNGIYEGCIDHQIERYDNGATDSFTSESISNLVIFDEDYKYFVTNNMLYSGHTYLITSVLPPTQIGLIPWKLEIYDQRGAGALQPIFPYAVRYSEEGYTRIKPSNDSQKTTIRVLQMNPKPNMKDNENPYVWFDEDYRINLGTTSSRVARQFNEYVDNLEDFKIRVKYLDNNKKFLRNNENWYEQFHGNKEKWKNYLLDNYDMLIIGFKDVAQFTTDPDFIYGFIEFKNAGRPIILSHDLVADASIDDELDKANDIRYFLRDISGQIRKYYNAAETTDPSKRNNYYFTEYWTRGSRKVLNDNVYLGDYTDESGNRDIREYYKDVDMQNANRTMDNANRILMTNGRNTSYYIDRYLSGINVRNKRLSWDNKLTNTVKLVNEGKISKYPYNLPEIAVRDTHAQNYQLDLEYDREGDVLVWYNLTGGTNNVYSGRYQDCRNNYYIYTKGNITYTGVGHYNGSFFSGGEMALDYPEIRLFINTMIAAYRSSPVKPYISVINEDAVTNGNTTTLYMEDKDTGVGNYFYDKNLYYKIVDDTTNTDIKKDYTIKVYKGNSNEPIRTIEHAQKGATNFEEIYYSEVQSSGEVNFRIELYSDYASKPNPDTPDWTQYVNIALMPMFDLR